MDFTLKEKFTPPPPQSFVFFTVSMGRVGEAFESTKFFWSYQTAVHPNPI